MRLAAGRWTPVRGRGRGRKTSFAPTFMLRPPLFSFLSLPFPCQPPSLCLICMLLRNRSAVFLNRTSLLLSPPSSLLSSCSPASGCFARGGAGLSPAPTASSLPCLHSGGLVQACLRRGTDFSSSSLLFLFFRCPGAGTDAKHTPYLPFFFSSLAEPAPCR